MHTHSNTKVLLMGVDLVADTVGSAALPTTEFVHDNAVWGEGRSREEASHRRTKATTSHSGAHEKTCAAQYWAVASEARQTRDRSTMQRERAT